MPALVDTLQLPNPQDAEQARTALRALASLPANAGPRNLRVQPGSTEPVTVPPAAFDLFLEVLRQMASGNAVTIVPVPAELTTGQAADLLNVSHPYLVGLLEANEIPHQLAGIHRRIQTADLMAYKAKDDERRKHALDELAAQGHDLGY